ncbi:hypothetical protein CEXT_586651 [Caerostris extrusa]|uniref:Uncharacterized protein n=1 Tax=Caerostris extrusa TaxID=172846 RepID=A0AAV4T3B3_CAEEX|nr:hypothetical protein CEXT_586651 [Caerostris extrusa]
MQRVQPAKIHDENLDSSTRESSLDIPETMPQAEGEDAKGELISASRPCLLKRKGVKFYRPPSFQLSLLRVPAILGKAITCTLPSMKQNKLVTKSVAVVQWKTLLVTLS